MRIWRKQILITIRNTTPEYRMGVNISSKPSKRKMIEVLKALQEAEISVACLQDDNFESKKELDKDLEHISNQRTIAINILKEQDLWKI